MSVFQPANVAYGLSQALIGVPNAPILSQRSPTTEDKANIGSIWINQVANIPFILTSITDNVATWISMNASGSISSIVTDSGTAIPVAGVINLFGGANIVTSASGDTIHVAVTDNINLPATNAAGTQGLYELGGFRFAYAYPPSNAFLGINAGNTTLNSVSAVNNTGVGNDALQHLTLGSNNTGVGAQALVAVTTGINNVALGYLAGDFLTTGDSNVALGNQAIQNVIAGNDNIAIGFAAGSAYTSSESSNIIIGSSGVVSESNVIRIGTQGSGAGEQDACAVAGIYNTGIGVTNEVVFVDSSGFLGGSTGTDGQVIIAATAGSPIWANLTAGTNITITNATNSITINSTASGGITTLQGEGFGSATGPTVNFTALSTAGASCQFETFGATTMKLFMEDGSNNIAIGLNTGIGLNDCVGIGDGVYGNNSSAVRCVAMGTNSLNGTGGNENTAIGYHSLNGSVFQGANNTVIGALAGSAYTLGESSNILVGNIGVASESHVIRIGTQGSGAGQQNECFIAGIAGVTVGSPNFVTINTSTGQLGSTASAGSGITTIAGDSGSTTGPTVTFNGPLEGGSGVKFTTVGTTLRFNVGDAILGNCIVGMSSGNGSILGGNNCLFGQNMASALSSGSSNTAIGNGAFTNISTSSQNVAVGTQTLESLSTSVGNNVGVGYEALPLLLTGANNIAIGTSSGSAYTSTESSNILVGNSGTISENNTIHIGTQGSGSGQQNTCFIAGIAGVTVASSAAVLINTSTGQLGTVASSRRYKENIEDMDGASDNIMNLRPVTFNYKNDPTRQLQYGLIAEEVDATFPSIVTYNNVQDPETVRYHDLPVLLLNELQKQHNIIASLMRRVEYLENKGRYESKT